MKKSKLDKKLTLNKKTVIHLTKEEEKKIRGGGETYPWTFSCPLGCWVPGLC